jgi:hypothetical protein
VPSPPGPGGLLVGTAAALALALALGLALSLTLLALAAAIAALRAPRGRSAAEDALDIILSQPVAVAKQWLLENSSCLEAESRV